VKAEFDFTEVIATTDLEGAQAQKYTERMVIA
jgi:hypothetical protein